MMILSHKNICFPLMALMVLLWSVVSPTAHQDACHTQHRCPSDHDTYVCGDTGHCEQCPDNDFCFSHAPRQSSSDPALPDGMTVCFTPGEPCTDQIVQAIASAQMSIYVQAYSFTSAKIAQALVAAYQRQVEVRVILDKSQRTEKYSSADFLANHGIPTLIDASHAIAHNKIIILDLQTVLTGSFNPTKAAQEKNAENLLRVQDYGLAARYLRNWHVHAAHSQPYVGKLLP